MNKDINLIFEAYKKKLTENVSFVPSDKEIQAVITSTNSKCTVEDVKAVVNRVIDLYGATNDEILRDGLYEDILDINNHGVMGGGKQRFSTKDVSTAELAVMLSDKIRINDQTKERNARGENAEDKSKEELTTNDVHHVIAHLFTTASKPSRHYPNIKGIYSGQIYEVLREMGHEYFDENTQGAVNAYEAHCMQIEESFDHAHSDKERAIVTHAEDPETDILWYNWSGDSYMSQAATESAIRLADKHGFNKVVINAQG